MLATTAKLAIIHFISEKYGLFLCIMLCLLCLFMYGSVDMIKDEMKTVLFDNNMICWHYTICMSNDIVLMFYIK